MNADKKEYELFLELLLLAEKYALYDIQGLRIKLKNPELDEKIEELLGLINDFKNIQDKKQKGKLSQYKKQTERIRSSNLEKYESRILKQLKQNDPKKYSILKPIEETLIKNGKNIDFSNIKDLVLELGGNRKDIKSRRDAIRVLILKLSKIPNDEIEKYTKNLYSPRKESSLDGLAKLIMGEKNDKNGGVHA